MYFEAWKIREKKILWKEIISTVVCHCVLTQLDFLLSTNFPTKNLDSSRWTTEVVYIVPAEAHTEIVYIYEVQYFAIFIWK